jgi:two-component system OmpR family response regulator
LARAASIASSLSPSDKSFELDFMCQKYITHVRKSSEERRRLDGAHDHASVPPAKGLSVGAMARILCIEDDPTTAQEIVSELAGAGYEVEWVADGREGLVRAVSESWSAITLDRMLPNVDGLTIVSVVRNAGIETPILMISALSDVDERVKGLRAGGDDYLTKPFASEELSARLEVLLRRQRRGQTRETVLRAGDLEMDLVTREVRRGGRELKLLPTEFKLLELLLRNAGQVLTRSMIFEAVWGYRFDPGTNLIDVHMGRLRRKVDAPGAEPLVQTVRGSGYALRAAS